jgi:hypothetical protein
MYLTSRPAALAALVCAAVALSPGCTFKDLSLKADGGVSPSRTDAARLDTLALGDASTSDTAAPLADGSTADAAIPGSDATMAAGKPAGDLCVGPAECASGFCADGVCCDSACAASCEACNRPDRRGSCAPISGLPRPGHEPCVGQGAGTCGGSCDGMDGARCHYPGGDVECAAALCSAGLASSRRVCSGGGVCLPAVEVSCAPYSCDGNICAGGCGPARPCAAGSYCTGGRCQPLQGNGAPCSEAGQCQSGVCAQGRCCDGACTGACQSCARSGALGTCGTISFTGDVANCGACGNRCSTNHVTAACGGGRCNGACAAGFDDCNNDKARDGCEVATTTASNCGGCGIRCPGTNCLAGGQCEKIEFAWSYVGPLAGKTCLLLIESADPHFWGDNHLCTQRDFGFVWSSAGPVVGMTCVQILEPSDPDTWTDNFLCAPRDYGLRWSYAGPIAGMRCTKIEEPSEPPLEAWTDNYLCAPP